MSASPGNRRRWSLCYRIAAWVVLLLAASPFTAPFSTYDAADVALHTTIASDDHGGEKNLDTAAFWLTSTTVIVVGELSAPLDLLPGTHVASPGRSLFALRL